jgi:hypothetical protein
LFFFIDDLLCLFDSEAAIFMTGAARPRSDPIAMR